jgi:alpha-methylacyl-CoA racemase
MAVAANEPLFWTNLCAVLERPDLEGGQFAEGDAAERVIDELRAIFLQRTRDEWTALCAGRDTCCTPVLEPEEAFDSEQVLSAGLLVETAHPLLGRVRQPAPPVRLSATPAQVDRRPAPALGQDTDDVLNELGYAPARIAELRASGATGE